MKRQELLKKLGYSVPENKIKRVIVHSDIACEADDQFAIVHHLLTPSENVVGIIAGNFEYTYRTIEALKSLRYTSMDKSYAEGEKILKHLGIDDIPLLKGAKDCIHDKNDLPVSEGSEFIIREALRKSEEPLFIALQGSLTDLAVAYLTEPKIADGIEAAIWIGGGSYPDGGVEPNIQQDVLAAQILFESPIKIWQIPMNVYSHSYVSFAELNLKVRNKGKIGQYLYENMISVNDWYGRAPRGIAFPQGEIWSIGDQPTVSVLLQSVGTGHFHEVKAPLINDDMTYSENPDGKLIRVYDKFDMRVTAEDLFAKLELCSK